MKKWVFWTVGISSMLILWLFQNVITLNIPWWDDFHGIILPVHDLFTNLSWFEKFKSFVSLNNEHRVINDRLFTLLIFWITGKFELKILALLGFINLIGIFWIIYKVLRAEAVGFLAILPVFFLIFHAQYFESLQSLMVPFQNFSVIFYMLLSLYFLTIQSRFGLSFLFALGAVFSHGNGILVLILGLLILLLNQDYRKAVLWSGLSAITLLLYFWGYSKPTWTDSGVISPFQSPLKALRYIFEFLGAYSLNFIELSTGLNSTVLRQLLPQMTGLVVVSVFFLLIFKKYKGNMSLKTFAGDLRNDKTNQFILAFALFFLGSGVLMGLTRTGFPVLSRYTINSSMFLIAVWMFYVRNFRKSGRIGVSILTGLVLILTYFNNTSKAIDFRENLRADALNYQVNEIWANNYSDSAHVSRVNPLIKDPLAAGEYVFPQDDLKGFENWEIKSTQDKPDFGIVDGYLMISGRIESEKTWFTLESDEYHFIFPALSVRNNIKDFLLKRAYYSDYYKSFFPVKVIPSGSYNIHKIVKTPEGYSKYSLNRTLSTDGMIY